MPPKSAARKSSSSFNSSSGSKATTTASSNNSELISICGFESKCDQILKDLQCGPGSTYIENDAGFKSIEGYDKLIPFPISIQSVREKLFGTGSSGAVKKYVDLNEFATDVRRIYGNFFRYNYANHMLKTRRDLRKGLFKFEQLWCDFLSNVFLTNIDDEEERLLAQGLLIQPVPELKACFAAIDECCKVLSVSCSQAKGAPKTYVVDSFISTVEYSLDATTLKNYLNVVKNPTCVGQIISNLSEGVYESVEDMKSEFSRLVDNCSTYWSLPEQQGVGTAFITDAMALQTSFLTELQKNSLSGPNSSLMPRIGAVVVAASASAASAAASMAPTTASTTQASELQSAALVPAAKNSTAKKIPSTTSSSSVPSSSSSSSSTSASLNSKPPVVLNAAAVERKADKIVRGMLKYCLARLKEHYILVSPPPPAKPFKVFTHGPFFKAVDPNEYPDYVTIVTHPMNLSQMEKRLLPGCDKYGYPGGGLSCALRDMQLLVSNAKLYNEGVEGLEVRIMADTLQAYFIHLVGLQLKLLLKEGDQQVVKLVCTPEVLHEVWPPTPPAPASVEDACSAAVEPDTPSAAAGGTTRLSLKRRRSSGKIAAAEKAEPEVVMVVKDEAALLQERMDRYYNGGDENPLPDAVKKFYETTGVNDEKLTDRVSVLLQPPPNLIPPPAAVAAPVRHKSSGGGAAGSGGGLKLSASAATFDDIDDLAYLNDIVAENNRKFGASPKGTKSSNNHNARRKSGTNSSSSNRGGGVAVVNLADEGGDDDDDGYEEEDAFNDDGVERSQPVKKKKRGSSSSSGRAAANEMVSGRSHHPVGGIAMTTTAISRAEITRGWLKWELAASDIIRTLGRHAFVDINKPQTQVKNFYTPIDPLDITEEYRRLVNKRPPMDLTTLAERLDNGEVKDEEEFTTLLLSIFQNAEDFNSPNAETTMWGAKLASRYRHLQRYVLWLCQGAFPYPRPAIEKQEEEDDEGIAAAAAEAVVVVVGAAEAKTEDELTKTETKEHTTTRDYTLPCLQLEQREAEKKFREEIISNTRFDSLAMGTGAGAKSSNTQYAECKSLLKKLEHTKNKAQLRQLMHFAVPVDLNISDYAVFVRSPIDLSSIKVKLDGTLPSHSKILAMIQKGPQLTRYQKFGEFISDLRRVFTNAIKYNSAHIKGDTTGLSQEICDAAKFLSERLETLLVDFSIALCDRILRVRMVATEEQQWIQQQHAKKIEEERVAREFRMKQLEAMKNADSAFAVDLDMERKQKETEQAMQRRKEANEAAYAKRLKALGTLGAGEAELVNEMLNDNHSSGALGRNKSDGASSTAQGLGNLSPSSSANLSPTSSDNNMSPDGNTSAGGRNMTEAQIVAEKKRMGLLQPANVFGFGVAGQVSAQHWQQVSFKLRVLDRARHYWKSAAQTHLSNKPSAPSVPAAPPTNPSTAAVVIHTSVEGSSSSTRKEPQSSFEQLEYPLPSTTYVEQTGEGTNSAKTEDSTIAAAAAPASAVALKVATQQWFLTGGAKRLRAHNKSHVFPDKDESD